MNSLFKVTSKKSDFLGRYYTDHRISALIYKLSHVKKNKRILDLACGSGSLSEPFLLADNLFNCTLVDIENKLPNNFFSKQKFIFYNLDLLLNDEIFNKVAHTKYDLAVCNPPYINYQWNDYLKSIIYNSKIDLKILRKKYAPAPVIFLAFNFKLLSKNGSLFIILPDQYITGLQYSFLRNYLINNYKICKVIKLPQNSFTNAQVDSYILEIKKGDKTNNIEFYQVSNDFNFNKINDIHASLLHDNFNINQINSLIHENKTCISFLQKIYRGNVASNKIHDYGLNIFHSTNCGISNIIPTEYIYKDNKHFLEKKIKYAEEGDIILCRIGRNFYKKIFFVANGYIGVSDHFFVIKVNNKSKDLYNWLIADGNERLKNLAHGSGAKFINIESFKSMCFKQNENKE